jgi:hypothetical protein
MYNVHTHQTARTYTHVRSYVYTYHILTLDNTKARVRKVCRRGKYVGVRVSMYDCTCGSIQV